MLGMPQGLPDGFKDVRDELRTSYRYQLQIRSAKHLQKNQAV